MIEQEQYQQLIDLLIDVYAHAELDYDVTLLGNSLNASECAGMARKIEEILNIEIGYDEIQARMGALETLYE